MADEPDLISMVEQGLGKDMRHYTAYLRRLEKPGIAVDEHSHLDLARLAVPKMRCTPELQSSAWQGPGVAALGRMQGELSSVAEEASKEFRMLYPEAGDIVSPLSEQPTALQDMPAFRRDLRQLQRFHRAPAGLGGTHIQNDVLAQMPRVHEAAGVDAVLENKPLQITSPR